MQKSRFVFVTRKLPFACKKSPQKSPFSVKKIKYHSTACYSGFMHGNGKKDPICRRLSKPTKYSNTKCFGGKDGRRSTSCKNLSDEEIDDLANKMCTFFEDFKDREDYVKYSPAEKYAILREIYLKDLKLTTGDELKLLNKVKATCLKDLQLTPNQRNIIVEIAKLPAKKQIQELSKTSPILINKIKNAVEVTNLVTTSVTENTNDVDKKEKNIYEPRPISSRILSNNMSEKEIETFGNAICDNFKKKKYSHLSTNERYNLLIKNHLINLHSNLKLTTEDGKKILAKLQTTCFKNLQLTPSQTSIFVDIAKLPKIEQKQALEELVITHPVLIKKVKESVEVGSLLDKLYENKYTIAGAATAAIGLLIYGKNKIEEQIEQVIENSLEDLFINLQKKYGNTTVVEEEPWVEREDEMEMKYEIY
jgi:hypothetical protein